MSKRRKRAQRKVEFKQLNVFERLDRRRMFDVSIMLNTLTIDGTAGDDVIVVGLNKRFLNIATVTIDDQPVANYALDAFTQVSINAGDGNDKIWIDSALDPLKYIAIVNGGAGNDMITTGIAADTIDAGDGDDKVYSNGGDDKIIGGAGRDSIWGGADKDDIQGNAGNDRISGESGNDVIDSGKGNDIVYGGDDADVLRDAGGTNWIDAGAGDDSAPKLIGAGTVYGGAGNDNIVAVGGALLYGEDGNDTLQAWWVDGGKGNDTVHGLDGNDELHGGEGDDLIRGYDGDDVILGDDGNDAIFGGGGTDSLYGGGGGDNLYGTNGHLDKHSERAGNDNGFGQRGEDWFETNYRWKEADRDRDDRPVTSQNDLYQDPSEGYYVGGSFVTVSTASLDVSGVSGSVTRAVAITNSSSFGGVTLTSNLISLVGSGNTTTSPTVITQPLDGGSGWLSSGAYDATTETFIPPAMPHAQRIQATPVMLQIPQSWNLGEMTFARDDVVWYQVWVDGATPPPADKLPTPTISGGSILINHLPPPYEVGEVVTVDAYSVLHVQGIMQRLTAGDYVWTGTGFAAADDGVPSGPLHTVPKLDGGTVQVVESTPHLYDGVNGGAYRFLGVHRGTILVSNATVAAPTWTPLSLPILKIASNATLRLAGTNRTFKQSSSYESLPTGGPKLRGISVDGGAIWLPTDGSSPYFSSGKN